MILDTTKYEDRIESGYYGCTSQELIDMEHKLSDFRLYIDEVEDIVHSLVEYFFEGDQPSRELLIEKIQELILEFQV